MSEGAYVWFVYERFEQLGGLLERWGWEIVERGDLSAWDERRRSDPVIGMVRIRGQRVWPLGGCVSLTAKEWWGHPPLQGPERQQGVVLAGYHYTAQSARGQVRHCFDTARHPQAPFHVHPHGGKEIRPESRITVEEVLVAFEQQLAVDLYEATIPRFLPRCRSARPRLTPTGNNRRTRTPAFDSECSDHTLRARHYRSSGQERRRGRRARALLHRAASRSLAAFIRRHLPTLRSSSASDVAERPTPRLLRSHCRRTRFPNRP